MNKSFIKDFMNFADERIDSIVEKNRKYKSLLNEMVAIGKEISEKFPDSFKIMDRLDALYIDQMTIQRELAYQMGMSDGLELAKTMQKYRRGE